MWHDASGRWLEPSTSFWQEKGIRMEEATGEIHLDVHTEKIGGKD